jgi:hypothetical protein
MEGYYLITFTNSYSVTNEAWVPPGMLGESLPGFLRDEAQCKICNVRVYDPDGNEVGTSRPPAKEQVTADTASRVRVEYYRIPPYITA